jgi:hypothetical protein
MLKRFVGILILVALVSSNLSRLFVFAGFAANRDYIASALCENKDKAWMQCNGKCYLMNKIRQAEEKEKKQEQEQKRQQHQEALPAVLRTVLSLNKCFVKKAYPGTPVREPISRSSSVFQPPKAS